MVSIQVCDLHTATQACTCNVRHRCRQQNGCTSRELNTPLRDYFSPSDFHENYFRLHFVWNIENTYGFDAKLDTNLVFDTFSQSKSHQNINVRQIYAFKIILLKNKKN